MTDHRRLHVASLGTVAYADALELQRAAARARIDGTLDQDLLILVEHPAVVTTGRSTKAGHLLLDREALAARGVELFDVERGGDVTFHGPGQLVGYPIIDLRRHTEDLHWYLRQVEQVLIDALGAFGIAAERNPGKTGVWTRGRKIASIGVHARQWVTWHGFALNVTTDLSYFDVMVPCGIPDVVMTSVEHELLDRADGVCLAPAPTLADDVREAVVAAAGRRFSLDPVAMDGETLRRVVGTVHAP
ncbi:MAG TPA: lipoyl(octanoyl) transferase LipB [Gemmatimonadaceae bacterium]|nr:lipoyl(octanoyl) transferase LipB [Gemmatimonadaceae bacterium]